MATDQLLNKVLWGSLRLRERGVALREAPGASHARSHELHTYPRTSRHMTLPILQIRKGLTCLLITWWSAQWQWASDRAGIWVHMSALLSSHLKVKSRCPCPAPSPEVNTVNSFFCRKDMILITGQKQNHHYQQQTHFIPIKSVGKNLKLVTVMSWTVSSKLICWSPTPQWS